MPINYRFLTPKIQNSPKITKQFTSLASGGSTSLTVQPPLGETWVVVLASVVMTNSSIVGGTSHNASIELYDGTTSYFIEAIDDATMNDCQVSVGSTANGPIRLTNSNYMVLKGSTNAGGPTSDCSLIAVCEVV